MRTKEFTLKYGVEKDGVIHKDIIIKALTGADEISLGRDKRLQELARNDYSMTGDAFRLINNNGDLDITELSKIRFDPIKLKMIMVAKLELTLIMACKMVMKLGELERPGREILGQLDPVDLTLIDAKYNELVEEANQEMEGFGLPLAKTPELGSTHTP